MFFWISCAAAGVSLCLVVWVFTRPVVAQDTDIPRPSHGVLFKLAWPWISVLSRLCGPFISWPMREALGRRIQIAGLASAWHADHVVALQCLVFFLTVLAATAFLLSALDMPAMQSLLLAVAAGLCACGDYIEGPYPATLEGAVLSGTAAATTMRTAAEP